MERLVFTVTTRSDQPGVVVHLADAELAKQTAALRNARNLRADLGPGTPIELVAHGPAVGLLRSAGQHREAVAALLQDGVAFAACKNSMRSLAMDTADLVPGVDIVPSGVGHLARRQFTGWAYVRP